MKKFLIFLYILVFPYLTIVSPKKVNADVTIVSCSRDLHVFSEYSVCTDWVLLCDDGLPCDDSCMWGCYLYRCVAYGDWIDECLNHSSSTEVMFFDSIQCLSRFFGKFGFPAAFASQNSEILFDPYSLTIAGWEVSGKASSVYWFDEFDQGVIERGSANSWFYIKFELYGGHDCELKIEKNMGTEILLHNEDHSFEFIPPPGVETYAFYLKPDMYIFDVDANAYGQQDKEYKFTFRLVDLCRQPPQVELVSPPNGDVSVSLTPTLTWNAVLDAPYYQLFLKDNLENIIISTIIDIWEPVFTISFNIPNGFLSGNTMYTWQVRALASDGCSNRPGEWSEQFTFRTLSPPNGLVLWNKLGSNKEVLDSAFGPDLEFYVGGCILEVQGDRKYMPGRFGNSIILNEGPCSPYKMGDSIHNLVLNNLDNIIDTEKGCIELWYYQTEPPVENSHAVYRLFDGISGLGSGIGFYVTPDKIYFQLSFNGPQRSVSFDTAGIPSNDWIHLAASWDRNGIKGRSETLELYINGIRVAYTAENDWGDIIGEEADICGGNDQNISGKFYMDNLIIWDYAKTGVTHDGSDFSGRNEEFPNGNTPPIADAGPNQIVCQDDGLGGFVTLDGSNSYDPDNDPLVYTWTWEGGSAIGVSPTVFIPLGTTTVTLGVSDGTWDSEADTVDITVESQLPAPVLHSPPDSFTDISRTPTLTWNTIPGSRFYHLTLMELLPPKNIKIDEPDLTTTYFNITSELDSNTSYEWKVTAINTCGKGEESSAFSFRTKGPNSPKLEVENPNGGEVLYGGEPYEITWNYAGDPGTFIKIEYNAGNRIWILITNTAPCANKNYTWQVPTYIKSAKCRIRITSVNDSSITDISNANFEIR